jgi:glycosyltransferase involved in cell wall biosynthesis
MNQRQKPLISGAIPAFNESANIREVWRRLKEVFHTLADQYDFEVVVCENSSVDDTYDVLKSISRGDPRLKIVRLSRNFHMEGGVLAALSKVRGDACVIMSADLQDPPEMLPQLITSWSQGINHVYTVITYRHGESLFRRVAAEVFYRLIDRLSDTPVPRNSSDFRIVDRQMHEAFNSLPEKDRMIRVVWGWLGFSSTGIEYERPPRLNGMSSFRPLVTASFAIRGLLASSLTPLKIIPLVALLFSSLLFLGLVLGALKAAWGGVPSPGFGTITSLIFLMFGLLFFLLSVLAEYVGMIYIEARG